MDFCLQSCSRVFSKCSPIVMSLVRLMASHPIFCLVIDLLHSGDNPFTRRASRAAWVTLFIFWNLECWKKRASRARFTFLWFVCLSHRPSVRAGRTLEVAGKTYSLFFEPILVEDLEDHPWDLVIWLPVSIWWDLPKSYEHL